MPDPRRAATSGPHQLLLGLYALFVVAAGARSAVQLALHAARAPLAYGLSVAAAAVYAAGYVAVSCAAHGRSPRPARVVSVVELSGVLAVGTASVLAQSAFPDATVWSYYGAGYLFVPLALPIGVLIWLRRR